MDTDRSFANEVAPMMEYYIRRDIACIAQISKIALDWSVPFVGVDAAVDA